MPNKICKACQFELKKRFLNKVNKTKYCWDWIGSKNSRSGYGIISVNGVHRKAHRISWEIFNNKEIPQGLNVLHKCDNKKCVNPKHLFLGTLSDNNKDRMTKGRSAFGEKHGKHKLLTKDVIKLRKLYKTGEYTTRKLAKMFNITHQSVWLIIKKINRKYE